MLKKIFIIIIIIIYSHALPYILCIVERRIKCCINQASILLRKNVLQLKFAKNLQTWHFKILIRFSPVSTRKLGLRVSKSIFIPFYGIKFLRKIKFLNLWVLSKELLTSEKLKI